MVKFELVKYRYNISVMTSIKALKRKSVQRKNNHQNSIHDSEIVNSFISKRSLSLSELSKINLIAKLRKTKSETNLKSIPQDIQLKNIVPAKSERNLNSVFNYMTSSTPCNTSSHNNSSSMDESSYSVIASENINIPIIGYEVMEERSRFTIFKLRIENYEKNSFWLVLRRFTDFSRLHAKLKHLYPNVNLVLPKKKWFGSNFSAGFLDTRVAGLQTFINTILAHNEMKKCQVVREFFCLDEPPLFSESMEDCKAIFEAQEETIAYLKMQLKAKDEMIVNLTNKNEYLTSLVKSSIGKCSKTDNSF